MPIGAPGWPEFAFCTASIASARMALAKSLRVAMLFSQMIKITDCHNFLVLYKIV
jgi:hypothetical protein